MSPFTPPLDTHNKNAFLRTKVFSVLLSQEASEGCVWPQSSQGASKTVPMPPSLKESQVPCQSHPGWLPFLHHLLAASFPWLLQEKWGTAPPLRWPVVYYSYYGNNCWVDFRSWRFCHNEEIKSSYEYDLTSFHNDILRWRKNQDHRCCLCRLEKWSKMQEGHRGASQARAKTQGCDSHLVLLGPEHGSPSERHKRSAKGPAREMWNSN